MGASISTPRLMLMLTNLEHLLLSVRANVNVNAGCRQTNPGQHTCIPGRRRASICLYAGHTFRVHVLPQTHGRVVSGASVFGRAFRRSGGWYVRMVICRE